MIRAGLSIMFMWLALKAKHDRLELDLAELKGRPLICPGCPKKDGMIASLNARVDQLGCDITAVKG